MSGALEVRVCSSCGIVAPNERERCEHCEGELSSALQTTRLLDSDRYWVGVQVWFECRVCGHDSPINHLDADGSVLCLRCGIEQKWEVKRWRRPIEHAHSVGDLAGPDPEGLFPDSDVAIAERNAYKNVGVSDTWAELERKGSMREQAMKVHAAPGAPLCVECHKPLNIKGRSAGRINMECSGCDRESSYEIPEQLRNDVRGVIASEHAVDSRNVKVSESEGGAVAISCPHCSAALEVTGDRTVVSCNYCNVSSRITAATMRKLGHDSPKAELWWVLLEGPSAKRKELVSRIRKSERKREANENKKKQQQQPKQKQQRKQSSEPAATRPKPNPKKRQPKWLFPAVAGITLTAAALVLPRVLSAPEAEGIAMWGGGDHHRLDAAPVLFDVNGDGTLDIVGLYAPTISNNWHVGAFDPRTLKKLWTVGPFETRVQRRYVHAVGNYAVIKLDGKDEVFVTIDMKTGKQSAPIEVKAIEARIVPPSPGATKLALNVRETNRFECHVLDPANAAVVPAPEAACQAPPPKTLTDGGLTLIFDEGGFTVKDGGGKQLFAQKGTFFGQNVGFRDGHAAFGEYVSPNTNALRLVDVKTGKEVWSTQMCTGDAVVLSDEYVFTNCKNRLQIVDRSDGKIVGRLGERRP